MNESKIDFALIKFLLEPNYMNLNYLKRLRGQLDVKQVTCTTTTSGITTLFYKFFRVKNSTSVESVQYTLWVLFLLTLVLEHTIGNEFNQYLEYPKAVFKWSS
jgi:hypothetical protein